MRNRIITYCFLFVVGRAESDLLKSREYIRAVDLILGGGRVYPKHPLKTPSHPGYQNVKSG